MSFKISTTLKHKCALCDAEIESGHPFHEGFLERPVCTRCIALIIKDCTDEVAKCIRRD